MLRKLLVPALSTLLLLAAGCGDDSGPSAFGPGGAGQPDDSENPVGDLLESLADGSVDSGDLDDLMESAENMAETFGDSGGGTVSINGDTIDFSSEICFAGQGDFLIEGGGATADGTPVWVSIDHSTDSRAEMAEHFDENMLQSLYGDADPIISSDITIDYGRTEVFGSAADDLPSFNASSGAGGVDDMSVEVSGTGLSGSGSAADYHYVAGEFDDRFDFTFQAACG